MKMKKRNYLFLLLLLVILFFVFNYNKDRCLSKVENKIINEISAQNSDLNLNKMINCIDWDKIVLIPRDFESIDMKKRFNINLSEYDVLGIKSFLSSDYYTYIVFLKDNKVTGKIDISSTGYIDNFLTDLNKDIVIIERKDASFSFIEYENYFKLMFNDTSLYDKYGVSVN